MRIVGTIPHPVVKITVFYFNERYTVKLEMGLMEQAFKIRESDEIDSFQKVATLITDEFINNSIERFQDMSKQFGKLFKKENE
jgi:hypothetical protein